MTVQLENGSCQNVIYLPYFFIPLPWCLNVWRSGDVYLMMNDISPRPVPHHYFLLRLSSSFVNFTYLMDQAGSTGTLLVELTRAKSSESG